MGQQLDGREDRAIPAGDTLRAAEDGAVAELDSKPRTAAAAPQRTNAQSPRRRATQTSRRSATQTVQSLDPDLVGHPELSEPRRWAVMLVFTTASMVAILGQLTMTASLSSIMAEFAIPSSQAQWLTTSYMLTMGIMVPCSSTLMARYQPRHLFLVCGTVFLTGVLGAFAPTFGTLVLVRCVQGFSAGLFIPMMQVVAFRLFPPNRRGFAVGVSAVAIAVGPTLGPVVAGVCTDLWGWRSVFLVVAILTLAYLACYPVVRVLNEPTERRPLDVTSVILVAVGFGLLTYASSGLSSQPGIGLVVYALVPAVIAVVALVLFVRRQRRLEVPLLDLSPFKDGRFTLGALAAMVIFGTLINTEVFTSLYVQTDQGFSPTAAGFSLMGGTVASALVSPISGRILDHKGPIGITAVGFALIVASGIMQAAVTPDSTLTYTILAFTIRGAGNGFVMQNIQTWSINCLNPQLISPGTAIANTVRQMGGAIINSSLFALLAVLGPSMGELGGMKVVFALGSATLALVGTFSVGYMLWLRAHGKIGRNK